MQVLVLLQLKEGLAPETLAPILREEESYVWRAIKSGIVRQVWSVTDGPAGIALLEVADLAAAEAWVGRMPAILAGLVEPRAFPLGPFTGLEVLFDPVLRL